MRIKSFTETLTNGFSFDMIGIEGGAFDMGSNDSEAFRTEQPVHQVTLDGFYIGKYPVTQALWKSVMKGDNPSFFNGDRRPVEEVSWKDTQLFVQKLNEMAGKKYRLPTEAEWEYAARGGNKSKGYKYAGSNKLKEVAWYWENSHYETKDVGLKFPNELGLYDMSGNVWEWCQDWYSGEYYEECHKQGIVTNPTGPEKGAYRVLRGGSWGHDPQGCRCTYRSNDHPVFRSNDVGFRLVFSLQSAG